MQVSNCLHTNVTKDHLLDYCDIFNGSKRVELEVCIRDLFPINDILNVDENEQNFEFIVFPLKNIEDDCKLLASRVN